MTDHAPRCFLVADVGGTNTRVALSDGAVVRTDTIRRYRNADQVALEPVLKDFVSRLGTGTAPQGACVAIAGPVRDGKGRLTNRDWMIEAQSVAEATGIAEVRVLNDLQAQGYAVDHVAQENLLLVRQGKHAPEGAAKLVVNLGTGFNASPVFSPRGGAFVATSESGHATMPVRTARDMRLNGFVEASHGFAGIDDILSGRGLERVYAFVADESGSDKRADSAAIIAGCASGDDPLAVEAVSYFIRLTAMVIGNLALVHLPFGGIYLVGGLSGAIAPFLKQAGFEDAFRDKGRFAGFMDDFSISIVQDDYAALRGMAAYLQNRLGD